MPPVWTNHITEQMALRCVSRSEVEDLLDDPRSTGEYDEYNESYVISGTVNGRHLEVAVTVESYLTDDPVLKTVML